VKIARIGGFLIHSGNWLLEQQLWPTVTCECLWAKRGKHKNQHCHSAIPNQQPTIRGLLLNLRQTAEPTSHPTRYDNKNSTYFESRES
jgi:hypothetical protein